MVMMGFVGVFVLNELRSLSSDTGYVTAARRDQAGCELELFCEPPVVRFNERSFCGVALSPGGSAQPIAELHFLGAASFRWVEC
jgi:hypothetical protein